jgi:hypothetical protein
MQGAIARRPSTRRRLIPRRPHPDIEFLSRRYDRSRLETGTPDDGARVDDHQELDRSWSKELKGGR